MLVPQACWDCRNKELGAFLHSPLMDELQALEALSDANREGLAASPRAAAAAFHAAAHPRYHSPGADPMVTSRALPLHPWLLTAAWRAEHNVVNNL